MAGRGDGRSRAFDVPPPRGAAEVSYQQRIEEHVAPEWLAELARPSWRDTVGMLGVIWAELIALLAAANLVGELSIAWAVPVAIVVMLAIATRINALNVVMHEGSHGFLARRRAANDWVCNAAASWWMVHSVEEYRPAHRLHHLYLHEDRDPDLDQYLVFDTPGSLTRLVLQDLVGLTALRRARALLSHATPSNVPGRVLRTVPGKLVTQLILLGQFVLFQGLWRGALFYAGFWLVPLVCVFPVLKRLKTITEHFDPALLDGRCDAWIARTSAAGWVQNHVVGARMQYHFEHHVLPTLPYRGLRQLHDRLDRGEFFRDDPGPDASPIRSGGYARFLRRLNEREPLSQSRRAVA